MSRQLVTGADGRPVVDVRGPRVGAALTTVVLATALIVQGPVGVGLVAWQWLAFAVSAVAGLRFSPYGNLFRLAKRHLDLGPPPATEPEGPPRFAQACGLVVATVALVAFALGATSVGWVAVGVVLALSALLASTGICLGCELHLLGQRLRAAGSGASTNSAGSVTSAPAFDEHERAAIGLDLTDARAGAVLLSSATCGSCEQVQRLLAEAAQARGDLAWVTVDAGEHLDLVRRHRVMRVPTLLVVDAAGHLHARSSGVPARHELEEVLDGVGTPTG